MTAFRPAEKRAVKLRAAIDGPTGSGKTKTALLIARGLVGPEGRIAVIDTEHGTAEKFYARDTPFDTALLTRYQPKDYIALMRAAEGYDCLIIDSLSHAWTDGVLAMVDAKGGQFDAWRFVTPHHNALVTALLTWPGHLIVTMRSRMSYEVTRDDTTGKTKVAKLGLKPVQREGIEYELDLVMDMDERHVMTVSKSRISELADRSETMPGVEFGREIAALIGDGIPEAPPAPPAPDARARARQLLEAVGPDGKAVLLERLATAGISSDDLADDAVHAQAEAIAASVRDLLAAAREPREPAGPVTADELFPGAGPDASPITQAQRRRLFAVAKAAGWTDDGLRDVIARHTGDRSTSTVTAATYEQVCADLEAGPQPTDGQESIPAAAVTP